MKLEGFIHICDYCAPRLCLPIAPALSTDTAHVSADTTLAALAGVDHVDHRAALANLPPVDGLNMAPYILGQTEESPRTEVRPRRIVLLP